MSVENWLCGKPNDDPTIKDSLMLLVVDGSIAQKDPLYMVDCIVAYVMQVHRIQNQKGGAWQDLNSERGVAGKEGGNFFQGGLEFLQKK